MTKIKKIVAAAVATIGIGAAVITANAEDYNNDFNFDMGMHGDSVFFPGVEKTSEHEYAQVSIKDENGFVTENSFVILSVYDGNTADASRVSESYKVVDLNKEISLDYIEPRGAGSINYLHGATGYYDAQVVGTWEP